MRIGLLVTSIGNFGQKGFYNAQEIGLAKALDKIVDKVDVYKLVSKDQMRKDELIDCCSHAVLHTIPAENLGTNGKLNTNVLDKNLDALIYFSDIQFSVPKIYRWSRKNNVCFFPYIGVTESHSTNRVKRTIANYLFKRDLAIYRKCHCFAKTPVVKEKLNRLCVQNVMIMPVGLDISLLKQNYREYPIDKLKEKYGYKPGDKVILFIGRMIEEKQPLKMLELFSKLEKTNGTYRLLMVGTGELDELVDKSIDFLNLKKKIRRIDCISNSDIWELYRIADAFVNLNRQEIFGMAILEAMYYGCKVVAWNAPGPQFIIENGYSGWLVKNDDEIVEKVIDPQQISKGAHQRVIKDFTWEATAYAMFDVIGDQL